MRGMTRSLYLVAAAAVAAVVALLSACEPRSVPAAFPHRTHLEFGSCGEPGQPSCLTCFTCHGAIRKASAQAPVAECRSCHGQAAEQVVKRLPTGQGDGSIFFPHAFHLSLPKIAGQCVSCHSGVPADGAQGQMLPSKAMCMSCHEPDMEAGRCGKCHRGTEVKKTVPRTFLRHDERFLREHGGAAARSGHLCQQCHTQSSCTACHDTSQTVTIEVRRPEAIDRGFVHRADFQSRHAIEARSQPARCLTCHEQQTCDSCHVKRGVSAARSDSANPHPIGWLGKDTESAAFHGRAARRDIVSCAACHDNGPATNCISCHRVGGPGGSPHPGGWQSSRPQSSNMCRYCHGS